MRAVCLTLEKLYYNEETRKPDRFQLEIDQVFLWEVVVWTLKSSFLVSTLYRMFGKSFQENSFIFVKKSDKNSLD
ncbi:hypothetical protein EGH10_06180 [Brevibacillus laterosporus]|nr:hypothetical protein P615_04915 [Brevibacillus laterosporus PE36]RJL09281.1 hypothetical protein DM460_15265 [Brevibacillus laterosporus]TPH16004.1 hypothetical protein EGH10_06180 [Brevibacillus laterosporus]